MVVPVIFFLMTRRPPSSTLFPYTALFRSVNAVPLLARPPTVTTTVPVVAPAGTGARMLGSDEPASDLPAPLNLAVRLPLDSTKVGPLVVQALAPRAAAGGQARSA